jgi:hypothetical protein
MLVFIVHYFGYVVGLQDTVTESFSDFPQYLQENSGIVY